MNKWNFFLVWCLTMSHLLFTFVHFWTIFRCRSVKCQTGGLVNKWLLVFRLSWMSNFTSGNDSQGLLLALWLVIYSIEEIIIVKLMWKTGGFLPNSPQLCHLFIKCVYVNTDTNDMNDNTAVLKLWGMVIITIMLLNLSLTLCLSHSLSHSLSLISLMRSSAYYVVWQIGIREHSGSTDVTFSQM